MSILDDYRRFQEEQRAKGIDPSVAPRLTQLEQDAMRLAATSPEPTTASPQPSGDDSSPNLFTESRTQTQARESVTDDKAQRTRIECRSVTSSKLKLRRADRLECTGAVE